MRIAFILLLSIHGLIHLMGFVKAFGFSNIEQLTQPISKPMGVLWLVCFILFVATAIMFGLKTEYWWMIGFASVLLSQVLVVSSWQDAKFGSAANLIVLASCIIGFGTWNFYNQYRKDVKRGFEQKAYFQGNMLTEEDLQPLPEPVRRYLRYTGSVGKPKVNDFRVEAIGNIRQNETTEWMPFSTEQHNFLNIPTRLYFMKAEMKHLPVGGYHYYSDGDARMDIRLFSMFKVQYMDGQEMDEAETVTFFNDMCCMAPATLIDPRIKWLETAGNKVRASFTVDDITISAWLYFDDEGALVNFISNDRYDHDAGKKLPWSTPLKDYREVNGYKLASRAEAIYTYPDKELVYGTFEIGNISYNLERQ